MTRDGLPQGQKKKVFISYSSASRERVGVLANALDKEGFEVWWDHALNPGEDYRQKIERALQATDVTLVCWTPAATVSDWVISEADDARGRNLLVPVLLQTCAIPKPFDRLHTSNLAKWNGMQGDPVFQRLAETVRAKAEGREPKGKAWRRRLLSAGGATAVAAAAFTGFTYFDAIRQLVDPNVTRADLQAHIPDLIQTSVDAALAKYQTDFRSMQGEDPGAIELAGFREAIEKAPESLDDADLEALLENPGALAQRSAEDVEKKARLQQAVAGDLWKQVGQLAFVEDTARSANAYETALAILPDDPESLYFLGRLYRRLNRAPEATRTFERLRDVAGLSEPKWQIQAFGNLGLLARDENTAAGDGRALDYFGRALNLAEQIGDDESRASQLGNLGLLDRSNGDLDAAEKKFTEALELNRKLARPASEAAQLGNLGLLARSRFQLVQKAGPTTQALAYLDTAQRNLEASLAIHQRTRNAAGYARQVANIGLVMLDRYDLTHKTDPNAKQLLGPAANRFEEALTYARSKSEIDSEARQLDNLGLTAMRAGNLPAAAEYFAQALDANCRINRRIGIALQLRNLGNIDKASGSMPDAILRYRQSRAIYQALGSQTALKATGEIGAELRALGANPDAAATAFSCVALTD